VYANQWNKSESYLPSSSAVRLVPIADTNMLSLDLGVSGHSHVNTGRRNITDSKEEAFLTVLHPSSVQIIYQMRSISKSEVRVLTDRGCDPRCVGVECISSLAHSAGRRTILLRMPQPGDQQMIGRYAHFGYEPLVLLRYIL